MIYLILLLSLILRLIGLNQSFWLDEAISALIGRQPFPYQITGISGDFQPPLFYLIIHFFMKLGIWNEWFLRMPSLFFGILTVWVIYKFTGELFGKKTAILSSLFLTVSQFHIYYSQEMRMYSLLCLLSLVSIWLFKKKYWLMHSIINILGFYTNYMFPLILVPQFLWTIKERVYIKKWSFSVLWTMLAFIPWIPQFMKQWDTGINITLFLPEWKNLSSLPVWQLIPQLFLKFTIGRISFDNKYFYLMVLLVLLSLYAYILYNIKEKINKKLLFVLNWLLTPLAVAVMISFFIPIANVWRLIFLLPPFLIIISYVISEMRYSSMIITLIVASYLTGDILYWVNPKYQREKWREAVSFLEEKDSPIVFTIKGGFAPYDWYKKRDKLICGPETINLCLKKKSVYYVSYLQELFDKNKSSEKEIYNTNFKLAEIKDFPGVGFVYTYENSN